MWLGTAPITSNTLQGSCRKQKAIYYVKSMRNYEIMIARKIFFKLKDTSEHSLTDRQVLLIDDVRLQHCEMLTLIEQTTLNAKFTDDVKLKNLTSIERTVKLQNPTTGQTPKLTNRTDTAPIKQVFTLYFVSQSIKRMYNNQGNSFIINSYYTIIKYKIVVKKDKRLQCF